MKKLKIVISLLLVMAMILATACSGNNQPPAESSTPTPEASTPEASTPEVSTPEASTPEASTPGESTPDDPDQDEPKIYNVIFALATIPPVLAALECIESGYPTYVIIERGKTFNGIESIENFYNVGFDPTNNQSTGFTSEEFDAMVAKVKELNDSSKKAFFNFYVQDGTALMGAAIAANAGVAADSFHVYMCEDGTGAYTALYNKYIKDIEMTAEKDGIYENYLAKVSEAKGQFDVIMSKTDNKISDGALYYNIGKAYALAALDNFTYYIQDEHNVVNILEGTGDVKSKLLSAFGVDGYDDKVEYELNLMYGTISAGVSALSEEQRTDYLTLMYGQYYAATYEALTRTERGGEKAPDKKLVFIGSRHTDYPDFVSNASFGIGGLAADAAIPATYGELDAKYKNELIFATEADYQLFLDVLANEENYGEDATAEAKAAAAVACFNYYVDYIFTLKMTYALYGSDYDIIMKGHPREAIGNWSEWGERYKVTYGEDQKYVYDKLFDALLLGFHNGDSTGKYIGMVPYGTAAENLAYLGADIAIAGLPSSTYSGFDTAVDVLFIMAQTNQDIVGSGEANAASQVKDRYEAGNLLYTDKEGNKQTTVFYNIGNTYKALAEILTAKENAVLSSAYQTRFDAWLAATYPEAEDIDGQGFPRIKPTEQ